MFISDSRKDQDFVLRLAAALEARGIDVSRDVDDLLPAAEWREQIEQLIAGSDSSSSSSARIRFRPRYAHGDESRREAPQAAGADRLPRRTDQQRACGAFPSSTTSISAPATRSRTPSKKLVTAINPTSSGCASTPVSARSRAAWDGDGRPRSEVLRGATLDAAERWLIIQPKAAPAPTSLHRELIAESRRRATRRQHIGSGDPSRSPPSRRRSRYSRICKRAKRRSSGPPRRGTSNKPSPISSARRKTRSGVREQIRALARQRVARSNGPPRRATWPAICAPGPA